MWYVYLLENRAGWSYVGATVDLRLRLEAHNGARHGGAKATRRGRPWSMATNVPVENRSAALRLEAHLKRPRGLKARRRAFHDALRAPTTLPHDALVGGSKAVRFQTR